MRSSLVVRASDCQCISCNGPGFDPSIRRHSGIRWSSAEYCTEQKRKNPPKKYYKKKNITRYTITSLFIFTAFSKAVRQTDKAVCTVHAAAFVPLCDAATSKGCRQFLSNATWLWCVLTPDYHLMCSPSCVNPFWIMDWKESTCIKYTYSWQN
jgi:hypothetical protein